MYFLNVFVILNQQSSFLLIVLIIIIVIVHKKLGYQLEIKRIEKKRLYKIFKLFNYYSLFAIYYHRMIIIITPHLKKIESFINNLFVGEKSLKIQKNKSSYHIR